MEYWSGVNLYVCYLPSSPDDRVRENLYLKMDSSALKKARRHKRDCDRQRECWTEIFTHRMLSQELRIPENQIVIERDHGGKPFETARQREFSVSHSDGIIVLATDLQPIGVDVERVREIPDLDDLIYWLSSDEQKDLHSKQDAEQLNYFFDLWTLKESYLKAIGIGLADGLSNFTIEKGQHHIELRNPIHDGNWHFNQYFLHGEYKCAICARNPLFPIEPVEVPYRDLID